MIPRKVKTILGITVLVGCIATSLVGCNKDDLTGVHDPYCQGSTLYVESAHGAYVWSSNFPNAPECKGNTEPTWKKVRPRLSR